MCFVSKKISGTYTIYDICGIKIKLRNAATTKRYVALKKIRLQLKIERILAKFKPCKKYKYIIPFGTNCIFSIVFMDYFRFSDSTFWNWVAAYNIDAQIAVMENYEILFSDGVNYDKGTRLWVCNKTGLGFHGKEKTLINPDGTLNVEKAEEDLKELIGRTKYLYEKTSRYLDSDSKKLITYTLTNGFKNNLEKSASDIVKLYEYLLNRTKNFDFLVMIPRQHYATIFGIVKSKYPEIYVRKIKSNFGNPKMYGFAKPWYKIFEEFRPEKILKSKYKKLKYNLLEPDRLNN